MIVICQWFRAKTAKSMRFMDSGPDAGGFGNDSDDDAIPIIPDLDDVRDEDMQLQVQKSNWSDI